MAIEKIKQVDMIGIKLNGNVEVRTANVILEDGEEIARTFHRHVLTPLSNTKDEDEVVKVVCNILHTDAVKAEAQRVLENQKV